MRTTIRLFPFVAAMAAVVIASNILVQYPFKYFGLGDVLTYGAFTYPLAFLVNDLTNRQFGSASARKVVATGFVLAVLLSFYFATPRIAIASGSAFLIAQLIDVGVFDRLRESVWWKPPFVSTLLGSLIDTILFFSLAFAPVFTNIDQFFGYKDGSLGFPVELAGITVPLWMSLALGDFVVKILVGMIALLPYAGALAFLDTEKRAGLSGP